MRAGSASASASRAASSASATLGPPRTRRGSGRPRGRFPSSSRHRPAASAALPRRATPARRRRLARTVVAPDRVHRSLVEPRPARGRMRVQDRVPEHAGSDADEVRCSTAEARRRRHALRSRTGRVAPRPAGREVRPPARSAAKKRGERLTVGQQRGRSDARPGDVHGRGRAEPLLAHQSRDGGEVRLQRVDAALRDGVPVDGEGRLRDERPRPHRRPARARRRARARTRPGTARGTGRLRRASGGLRHRRSQRACARSRSASSCGEFRHVVVALDQRRPRTDADDQALVERPHGLAHRGVVGVDEQRVAQRRDRASVPRGGSP